MKKYKILITTLALFLLMVSNIAFAASNLESARIHFKRIDLYNSTTNEWITVWSGDTRIDIVQGMQNVISNVPLTPGVYTKFYAFQTPNITFRGDDGNGHYTANNMDANKNIIVGASTYTTDPTLKSDSLYHITGVPIAGDLAVTHADMTIGQTGSTAGLYGRLVPISGGLQVSKTIAASAGLKIHVGIGFNPVDGIYPTAPTMTVIH